MGPPATTLEGKSHIKLLTLVSSPAGSCLFHRGQSRFPQRSLGPRHSSRGPRLRGVLSQIQPCAQLHVIG